MHTLPYEIDCTTCGCADTEVEREPAAEGWFADGVAHCNNCNQTFGFRAPKEVTAEVQKTVVYNPIRCPACNSLDVPVTRTVMPVRYHHCRACGHTFKSVEKRQ